MASIIKDEYNNLKKKEVMLNDCVYRNIYIKLIEKIKLTIRSGQTMLKFKIPIYDSNIIINTDKCSKYLELKLSKDKINYELIDNNTFYINW